MSPDIEAIRARQGHGSCSSEGVTRPLGLEASGISYQEKSRWSRPCSALPRFPALSAWLPA